MPKIRGFLWLWLVWVVMPLMAQPGQTLVWQPIEKDALYLRLPPAWVVAPAVNAPNALLIQAPTPDVSLSVTLRSMDRVVPLQELALATLREYTAENGYTLISVLPVLLPIGEAQRFESLRVVRGVRLRLVQYFIIVNTALLTLQGVLPDDPTLDAAPFIEIFDRAASTLRLKDTPAPAFFTDATGGLRLWLPPDWQAVVRDNRILTFVQPAYKAVFTVMYRQLEAAPLLVEIAQAFLNTYAAQNISVEAFEAVNLPIGEAYRALLANVPVQAAGGGTILTKQYQFIVVRDNWLIVMNAGSETLYFDTIAPILLRMADTLELAE